jgi:hypothetical protein
MHLKLYTGIGLVLIGSASLFVASTGAIGTSTLGSRNRTQDSVTVREGGKNLLPHPEAFTVCAQKLAGVSCAVIARVW